MTKEELQKYDSGFNEGFLYAAQVVSSAIIRNLHNSSTLMLPKDKERFIAEIQLSTKYILQKRKLIPTTYQIMRGEAEEVKLDFNLFD